MGINYYKTGNLVKRLNRQKVQTVGPDLFQLLLEVCKIFKVNSEDVLSDSRKEEYMNCRRIFIHAALTGTNATLSSIAETLKRKDHTTIINHRNNCINWMIYDKNWKREWESFVNKTKLWTEKYTIFNRSRFY